MFPGDRMMALAERLWPIGRSLTGQGVRDTLAILSEVLPGLEVKRLHSGETVSDWTVPYEWNVEQAYILDPSGRRICDYAVNNLHLMGYSIAVDISLTLEELQPHLYSLEDQPTAVPYVTSYYKNDWGFCIEDEERKKLETGTYRVLIDSRLERGHMEFGELLIRGSTQREVLISTYICHPSMANNEISGPVLASELARFVSNLDTHYSYRFLFIPETIGSIAYISKHLPELKNRVLAGFVLTCVGDERTYSYLPSRRGDSVADRAALAVLNENQIDFQRYTWADRGSDERQYCAPGVDLPVCSVMRSKYGEYPEYHTSLDRLWDVVTSRGLQGSFEFYSTLIHYLEKRRYPKVNTLGEPQLGKRGLYPNTSVKGVYGEVRVMMDAISQMDGTHSILEIASMVGASEGEIQKICALLETNGLVSL